MPRKKPKSSQKQKHRALDAPYPVKQKQSITINVGQKAPRRAARPRVPPQLPRGQMPSFSFGSTHIQPQSKEPMFRELYEQEKQKVHFLKQNVEVNRLAVAHAQTDNRQVQMDTVAESEHVRVNMNNRPRVSSHLDRFQQQEIESLGSSLRQQTPAEHGTILRSLEQQMDAVKSARPPLEDDEISGLSEHSHSGLFHDRKEAKSVFSLHANEEARSSIPDAEDIGQRDDPILSHHVNTPSALSVAIDESNGEDDTKYGADEDGEGSTNASHKISDDRSPVEPYDSEASKHALFAEMKEDEKRTQGIALADRGTPGQRLNLFEGISGRATHFLKLPDTAESKTPEIETSADTEPKGNALEKQSQSKKERNPGVGLGSGNARGLREGPLKQLGRPANISPMHANPNSEAVSFF